MFVFYFGLMADVSPPVGLAAYAGGGDFRRRSGEDRHSGFQVRNPHSLLPFIFIFNTELLMIDIGGVGHFIVVVGCSIIAMGCFVAATRAGC